MSCSVQIKSRNTVKMKKVNNVVHRTTSETLRLNEPEVLMNNTSRQALSAISPPILKKSSCSFQITGVSLTQRTDLGDDSADDLDESHTDDISRVTDNETPSFSEDTCSRDTEDNIVDSCSALCSVTVIPTVPEFELENILSAQTSFITTADFSETSIDHLTFLGDMASNPPTTKNQRFPGTRFTVVKIETGVPVRRGRWECLDYIDNSVYTPKHALTYNSPTTSDLSSTNTQPHYTMTPTTPTSNPMQGDFAALGTNYIDTVNKLLQSLSPPIPGMTQAILASSAAPHFPLDSSLANQQLSPGAAVPPSLSSPIRQDYTAILSNLITAQMSKTTTTQQSTTLPLVNPQLSTQFLNQTSGYSSQDSIQTLQSQPSMYASPTHGSVSATQIPRTFVQSLYSSPSLPITSINISTTLGSSETLIQNQISGYCLQPSTSLNQGLSVTMQRNIQSQPTVYSTSQIQGQVQQQMIYSSPIKGSASGYLPQHSTALIVPNQSSPLTQQNVQIHPTVYSASPTQNQAARYASPIQGQVQQQAMYSTPQAFPQPVASVSQTLYSTQSQSFTSPVQGSASVTRFRSESESTPTQLQGGVQNQNLGLYSTQPQVSLQSLTSQPTSYLTQSQGAVDYVTQAKQIILQLQNQSQIQLQNTTYSTTLASQNSTQASLPALGQSSSYVQQPQVQICTSTYSAPQIQRQISAPPVYNQSSTYLPQQSNTNYSSLPQVLTSTANLMPQVSSQPQVPSQSTSFVSLPQNQTNLTTLPSQPSTNYLFQTSTDSQNYLHLVQSQPSNYVSQPFTYQSTASGVSLVAQTSANQASYYTTSVQNEAQHRRVQFSNDPHHSFSGPQTADYLSDPYIPSHLRHYSSNVLQTSCSVIQLHKQGQPASYVALPQEHGAYVLHHVPSLSAALNRKSSSSHQSRLNTQTSIHSYLPHTEKLSSTYIHQPGPTHNLTHQVSGQKRRLVGQTLNFSLEPEIQSVELESRSSLFSFHNRAICSTYSKVKDLSKSVPQKSIFLPHDSTTVTASIMKPIATGSVTPVKTSHEKSGTESDFLDKLKFLDIPHSSTIDVVENLEQVLDAGVTGSDIAVMELKPAANNTSAIIDTKIEQAMDLVKSHLLYTVREEVEVLKLRISELLTRINQLEKENSFLKANATPEVLTALNTRSEEVQTDETSFSTDAAPQGDATVPAVPIE